MNELYVFVDPRWQIEELERERLMEIFCSLPPREQELFLKLNYALIIGDEETAVRMFEEARG
jgi:hypothetical protein